MTYNKWQTQEFNRYNLNSGPLPATASSLKDRQSAQKARDDEYRRRAQEIQSQLSKNNSQFDFGYGKSDSSKNSGNGSSWRNSAAPSPAKSDQVNPDNPGRTQSAEDKTFEQRMKASNMAEQRQQRLKEQSVKATAAWDARG